MHRSSRQSFWTLCFVGLLAGSAAAQGTGTLRGQVLNSVTRQPIARVLVTPTSVAPGSESAAFTDAAGRFTFTNVAAGSVQVRLRRPGYFDPGSRQTEAFRSLSFVPGGPEPILTLEPAAAVQGQVVLPDGEPSSGIRVDLLEAAVAGGHRYWRQRDTTTAEGDGSFEFAGLEPGSYLVHSQPSLDPSPDPSLEQQPTRARSGYLPMFAPSSREIESAGPVQLEAGQTAAVKLNLVRAVFRPVSIQVAGPSGALPVFQVSGSGFLNWPARFDRQTGSLTTDLPSGNYLLSAVGGRRGATMSGTLPLHLTEGAPGNLSLTVDQSPPATVVTRSLDAAASTAPNSARLAQLLLLPVDAPESLPLYAQLEQDATSDTAVIRNGIPAGRYWVQPIAASGYVAELTSQGTNLLAEPLSVAPGAELRLDAAVRSDAGSLVVTRAGELLSRENMIEVLPLFAGGREMNQSGSFGGSTGDPVSFPNLAPGDYLVLATSGAVSVAYREPGVLQQIKGTRVTVTAGAATPVTLSTLSALPPGTIGAP